ncbi:uncharacterized protein EI90DRAFT_1187950 [Cantharellus anzutake]|uniref:uncharacterized protein n=1 Tax=Cantharellus anzutake TaxID=1750568 RepID=UPI001903D10E|nr:uncharacterized protein EI90DRAFT_1187950 [Cantharellus anzutake]KAF8330413.1 hypothetical protein EI90DRAFT_1187950 [Cantharellus anzutake]
MHDRACELFYSIKGGTVDYGYVHAKSSFHSRYGRHYQTGSYPSWSRSNPIHFVTHSLGGTTVTVMQQLINEGHFGFENGIHPDMVASVTAVSAPFKGTGFAYIIGEDRKCAPEIEYFSVNSFIVRSVHTLSYFAPLIPSWIPLPDWHRDARRMTMTEISFWEYLKQMWRSDWGERKDVISFDATYEGPVEWERFWNGPRGKGVKGKEESRTYYRSYVACMTQRASPETTRHVCSWKSNILESIFIYFSAHLLGNFDYGSIRPVPWFMKPRSRSSRAGVARARSCGNSGPGNSRELGRSEVEEEEEGTMFGCGVLDGSEACVRERDLEGGVGRKNWHGRTGTKVELSEDYYANDGVVPLFSQFHPAMPKSKPKPGIWNVCYMPDTTHLSLMPLWRGTRMQKEFWTELGEWLEVVDEARMESDVEGKASEKVGGKRAPVVPVRSFSRPL